MMIIDDDVPLRTSYEVYIVVKVIFHTIKNYSGSKFFPIREVPILKRDAIEEKHCSIQYSPFDVRNFFSVLATPLKWSDRFIGIK